MDGESGLIALWYDKSLGVKGDAVNIETLWNWDDVKIDVENKTLSIKKRSALNNNNALEYGLDGWTGRYGMPLEFLLSIHIATMKPDLAYDMATSFNTNVNIYLHDITGEAVAAYKGTNGYVDTPTLEKALNGFEGRNLITAALNKLDDLGLSEEEAEIVIGLGIVPPGHGTSCTCTYSHSYTYGENTYTEDSTDYPLSYNDTDKYYYITVNDEDIKLNESDLTTTLASLDGSCKKFIKRVIKQLNKNTDYGFKAYEPYIANVTNHWYRNVYYVRSSSTKDFVTYDYDYETVMNERWTLYETDETTGEYVLYLLNDNGTTSNTKMADFLKEKGYETQEEAEENGYAFVKKAVTIDSSDEDVLEDLGWSNTNKSGVWTAYEENSNKSTTGYELIYDDPASAADGDSVLEEIYKNLYIAITTTGNITQTGEGQRTETNSTIKKMFLTNKYFTYDGTTITAEIIEKFRNDKGIGYGALTDEELKKTVKYDADGDGETEEYTASDYASTVSLEQDSLDAFSMLENTHTLDADYIYRDFKELIVELGYFTKEELTDETPRLLEWIIPEINSYGFPKREIDKHENEFGTMAHSRNDYTSYSNPLTEAITEEGGSEDALDDDIETTDDEIIEDTVGQINESIVNAASSEELATITVNEEDSEDTATEVSGTTRGYLTSLDTEATLESEATASITDVVSGTVNFEVTTAFDDAGWDESKSIVEAWATKLNINTVGNYYTKGDEASYLSFMQSLGGIFAEYAGEDNDGTGDSASLMGAQEFVYSTMWLMGFDYCAYTGKSGYDWDRCTALLKSAGSRSNNPYTAYPSGHGNQKCISGSIDKTMISQVFTTNCNYTVDKVMYKAGLMGHDGQPRSSCKYEQLVNDYGGEPIFEISDLHFGDLIECFYDNGNNSTNPSDWSGWHHVMYVGEETEDTIVIYMTGHDFTNDGNWRYELSKSADRSEMPASSGWVGIHLWDLEYNSTDSYKGYEGNEAVVSPVTGVLLEYGTYDGEIDSLSGEEYRVNTDLKYGTDGLESETVSDKVGYAKILVLDAENYKKLESSTSNSWKTTSLVSTSTKVDSDGNTVVSAYYKDNPLDDESEIEDWAEEWSDIDKTVYGYKQFAEEYEAAGISGYIIYIDGFSCELVDEEFTDDQLEKSSPSGTPISKSDYKITESQLGSDDVMESLYEQDETYKLASQKATDKANAEAEVKNAASSSIAVDDIIFIKEGTVLGRTLTDYELVVDYRNEDYETYMSAEIEDEETGETETVNRVIGNYIRIEMFDTDKAIVENVEDYMKLDDGESDEAQQQDFFNIFFTLLDKNEWVELAYAYGTAHGADSDPFQNKTSLGEFYDICVNNTINPEIAFVKAIGESSLKSSNGNYWGMGTPNGSSLKDYGGWKATLEAFCEQWIAYQDPTSSGYKMIMNRYEERAACTDYGGADPNGYGEPSTLQGIQSIYSWLGDDHTATTAGGGGMYYLDPWDYAGAGYEGDNYIIFKTKEEFEERCGSKHGTSGGKTSTTATTVWEQNAYTAWQVRKLINSAKSIFGDIAGTSTQTF